MLWLVNCCSLREVKHSRAKIVGPQKGPFGMKGTAVEAVGTRRGRQVVTPKSPCACCVSQHPFARVTEHGHGPSSKSSKQATQGSTLGELVTTVHTKKFDHAAYGTPGCATFQLRKLRVHAWPALPRWHCWSAWLAPRRLGWALWATARGGCGTRGGQNRSGPCSRHLFLFGAN